jgi:NADPH:quinone reductase-like Zn-dependent oxidoreductase
VFTGFGPPEVLRLTDVPEPRPKRNQVCIRMVATAVTASDTLVRGLKLGGWRSLAIRLAFPLLVPRRILGMIASGVVESAGRDVTGFKAGDEVFGMDGFRVGCYAEKVCWPQGTQLAIKPVGVTFEEAAALPYGALIASHFMRRLDIHKDQRVLVYGASGAIGTAAVQLARHRGAHVTGVCSSANLELVRSLGADAVFDYTREDFTRMGERYDVIFDAVGRRKSAQAMANSAAVLAPTGRAMSVDDQFPRSTKADLMHLKELAETGAYRAVIDRTYPLEEIVEAHRYVDQGHKKGNVIVRIAP